MPGRARTCPAERADSVARDRRDQLRRLELLLEAVQQADAEFRAEVGADVATVVAIGLEAYAFGAA